MKYRPLSELADVKGGKRLPKGKDLITTPTAHPYIRVRDLGTEKVLELLPTFEYIDDETQQTISRYTVNQGDVIISIVGTIGLVAVIGKSLDKANLTENCAKLVNIRGLDRDFLYYYLLSENGQNAIKAATVGAVQSKLPLKNIQAIPIPDLSINEQCRIAETLSALDAKIANNMRIIHHLEQMTQAIFKNWFVDFEPWGGVMPDVWRETELGEIAVLSAGGDKPAVFSQTPTEEYSVPVYSNGIDNFGLYGYTDHPKVSEESITVSARGTIGYVCLRQDPFVPIVRLVTVIPNSRFLTAKYLYLYLQNIHIAGVGTTQQQLTVPDFKKYRTLVPSLDVVTDFTFTVEPMFDEIRHKRVETARLIGLRDTLLPRLLSGELSVSDIYAAK